MRVPGTQTDPAEPSTSQHHARHTGAGARVSDPESIGEVRAFNRFYTNLIGALDYSRQLYTPYTLTEARVLYELLHSPRTDAADLRGELSLDAGYLSRMLTKFESGRLIERGPSQRDPRRQHIALTSQGRATAELLEERSQDSVGALLAKVPARDRPRLTEAMRTIRDILAQGRVPERENVRLRSPDPGDLGWMIQRNAALYAAEYGWNSEYEALVAGIVADFAERHDPRLERVWIAELHDRPVGSVMCVRDTPHDGERRTAGTESEPVRPGTARLRLLLVEPEARGLGIGDLLVGTCIGFAREAGYADMVLWTNDVLHAARRIYQRHGFTLTASAPHHSFGADLTGQDWHLPLRPAES